MEKREIYKVFDNLFDAVYVVDADKRIIYWNDSAERLTGYGSSEMLGFGCHEAGIVHLNKDGESYCSHHCPLLETDPTDEVRRAEVFIRHKEGHMVSVQARMFPFRSDEGHIIGAAEIFSDVSVGDEVRKRLAELESLARLDPLTRLANRRHMEESIRARLAELERFGQLCGFILMDIDNFDKLNKQYGHDAGDDILKMVARTLILNSRPFDIVGRWEDDTFAALVVHLDAAGLQAAADRLRVLIESSELPWGGSPLCVKATTVATLAGRGDTTESLVTRAEKLLREKKSGRSD